MVIRKIFSFQFAFPNKFSFLYFFIGEKQGFFFESREVNGVKRLLFSVLLIPRFPV